MKNHKKFVFMLAMLLVLLSATVFAQAVSGQNRQNIQANSCDRDALCEISNAAVSGFASVLGELSVYGNTAFHSLVKAYNGLVVGGPGLRVDAPLRVDGPSELRGQTNVYGGFNAGAENESSSITGNRFEIVSDPIKKVFETL